MSRRGRRGAQRRHTGRGPRRAAAVCRPGHGAAGAGDLYPQLVAGHGRVLASGDAAVGARRVTLLSTGAVAAALELAGIVLGYGDSDDHDRHVGGCRHDPALGQDGSEDQHTGDSASGLRGQIKVSGTESSIGFGHLFYSFSSVVPRS